MAIAVVATEKGKAMYSVYSTKTDESMLFKCSSGPKLP